MARPNWEYIRVDVLLPDHPKLDGLSYAAKWTLIELWCHCGQRLSDGFVRDAAWSRFGTPAARRQIVERDLAERVSGGYRMRNYLGHQRSRVQVEELRKKRSESGRKGGRATASAQASAQASAGPQDGGHPPDLPPDLGVERHADTTFSTGPSEPRGQSETSRSETGPPQQVLKQVLKQNSSKTQAEAEAEAEVKTSGADAVDQSPLRNARKSDDDEIDLIISEIHLATGRDVSRTWAADVRATLMNGRDVTNPAAYLRQVIRTERDPAARFLPLATSHPSARPVSEASLAAGIAPNGTPARSEDIAAIAAHARAALHTPKGTGP